MIIGYARVSTTEQNLGLRHDDLKPAFDASVDPTEVQGDYAYGNAANRVGRPTDAANSVWRSREPPRFNFGLTGRQVRAVVAMVGSREATERSGVRQHMALLTLSSVILMRQ